VYHQKYSCIFCKSLFIIIQVLYRQVILFLLLEISAKIAWISLLFFNVLFKLHLLSCGFDFTIFFFLNWVPLFCSFYLIHKVAAVSQTSSGIAHMHAKNTKDMPTVVAASIKENTSSAWSWPVVLDLVNKVMPTQGKHFVINSERFVPNMKGNIFHQLKFFALNFEQLSAY
jgi:hypothetical protein